MGNPIVARIGKCYPSLSKAHKKAADFVLNNLFRAATMSIDELAEAAGMSVATANRFARALGYDGYPPFRADLVAGFASTLAPVEKLRNEVQRTSSLAEVFASVLRDDIQNLEETCRVLDVAACERAVEMISGAERVFALGFGASAHLAGLVVHGLEPYCANVQSAAGPSGASGAARMFAKLSPRDLVIAICFPRYHRDTIELARSVHQKGIPLLGLTDKPTSPLGELSDVTLYMQTNRQRAANSDTVVLSMIQAICDGVAHRNKESVHAASLATESVLPWLYDSNR